MKKNIVLCAVIVLTALSIFCTSCKKDDDPQDFLVEPNCWKLTKTETRENSDSAWVDDTEACGSDNCWKFSSDGKVTTDEGATKCDVDDPQTETFIYTLSEDGKALTLTDSGFSLPFTVVELTAKKMVLISFFFSEDRLTFTN